MTRHTVRWRALRVGVLICGLLLPAGAHAASCDPLPRGILGFWPGDGNANDITLQANHGTLVNGTTFTAGVSGDAFLFDGVNDRLEVPDAPALRPQQFTLAAWVRAETSGQWACILCKQVGSGSADSLSLWLNFGVLQGGMFGFTEAVAGSPLPVGRFVHTAVSYDGSILRLYVDGQMISAAPGPASPVPYDSNPLLIGSEDNGVNAYTAFFKGAIDEAQIFGRALSTCEIRALYRARANGVCKGDADGDLIPDFEDNCAALSNAGQQDTDADGAGDACDCAPADPAVLDEPGDRHLLAFLSKDTLDWCLDPTLTGSSTVYDLLRGDLNALPVASAAPECRSRCIAAPSGLVHWWPGDGSTADVAGGSNGALENGAGYGSGWTLQSFGFDGINDRVKTVSVSAGTTFSVAAWVNSDVVNQGAYHRIVENAFNSHVYVGTDATGAAYKLIVKSATAPYGQANGGKIVPGEWQHVVGTYDGTTGRLYVDGKLVAQDTFAPPGAVSLPVNIGAHFQGGFGWKGRIDEVQMWDRALTAVAVRALYDAGGPGACKVPFGGVEAEWKAPWAGEGTVPAPGQGFFYLYRGRNGCGTGSYGYQSDGTERVSPACD